MDLANYYKTKLNIYLLLFILDKCKEVTEEQSENISLILFNNFLISIF